MHPETSERYPGSSANTALGTSFPASAKQGSRSYSLHRTVSHGSGSVQLEQWQVHHRRPVYLLLLLCQDIYSNNKELRVSLDNWSKLYLSAG